MRAVIYARYSSDNQRVASIADQVRLCMSFIDAQGWSWCQTYSDEAMSGASMLRAGYQRLLEDARRQKFDVLVAEGLDRLSRDQADTATLFKQLSFHGVRIITVAEGEISELHVGLKGTMNALYLKDLAIKTRRGLEGRIREGRSGGGISYAYDLVPGEIGARRINAAEAVIVRRIFGDYAIGRSPRAIAKALNMEGIPGPQGREWRDTAIRGHITRGTGILNNEFYVGRLVWNRLTYQKDPSTGKRRSRINAEAKLVVEEVPDLRIVDDALWQDVKRRQSGIRESEGVRRSRDKRFWETRRAQHILTGVVFCASCGSRFAAVGRDYLACSAARGRGTCANRTSIRRTVLEALILDGLRHRLMAPELVEEFISAFHVEVNRQRRVDEAAQGAKKRELAGVNRKISGLLDAIEEGLRGPDVKKRLDELSARRDALAADSAAAAAPPVRLHPNLAQVYRAKVEALQASLKDPDMRDEAIAVLRSLIERINVSAGPDGPEVEIVGEIARMVELGLSGEAKKKAALNNRATCSVKVVAGACNHRQLLQVAI